jgi:hypothetical protein
VNRHLSKALKALLIENNLADNIPIGGHGYTDTHALCVVVQLLGLYSIQAA